MAILGASGAAERGQPISSYRLRQSRARVSNCCDRFGLTDREDTTKEQDAVMHYKFPLVAVAATIALSACSSSLTGGATPTKTLPTSGPTATEANNINATYQDYQTRIGNNTLKTTTSSGTATMAGYMGITGVDPNSSSTTVIGSLDMNVDFNAGTLTGKGTNFGIYSGDPFTKVDNTTGSLDVAGTVSGSGMTATAKGALTDSTSTTGNFNLNLTGSFYDDAGVLTAVGEGSGTMVADGTTRNVTSAYYATKK